MPKYIVHEPIWSRVHQAYFQPGDIVEFDEPVQLEEGQIPDPNQPDLPLLESMGVLEPIIDPIPEPEPALDVAQIVENSQEDANDPSSPNNPADIASGITPSYAAADAGNHSFANDGNVLLHVKNTSGAPVNVTIETPNKVGGLVLTAPVVAVPATTGDKMIGPFDPTLFNQVGGIVYVDLSAQAGVTLAAIEI